MKNGEAIKTSNYGWDIFWAMPEDGIFPEPDKCPKLENTLFEYPRPQEALEDIMEVIDGDGSELSYISASLLAREISEFGAYWHGCSWSSHTIIDDQFSSDEFTSEEMDNWDWTEGRPNEWRPSVIKTQNKVVVNFYTYTGLVPAGITRKTDTFSIGSYCFTSDSKMIGESGGGYIY